LLLLTGVAERHLAATSREGTERRGARAQETASLPPLISLALDEVDATTFCAGGTGTGT